MSYGGGFVLGDNAFVRVLDSIFGAIESILEVIIRFITSTLFANEVMTAITFFVFINFIAIMLMKKDKQYAETPNARRVRESTLMLVALVGGSFGEYYAMYKYKHKTLHKKFLYGVPLAMLLHSAMFSYLMIVGIMA